jgi:hypothetical protein
VRRVNKNGTKERKITMKKEKQSRLEGKRKKRW